MPPLSRGVLPQMKRHRLLLMATASVITIGVIAFLFAQRPPFSFIPTSKHLSNWQFKPKEPGKPASCSFYSFPADFNSICSSADAKLLSLGYKEVRFPWETPDEIRRYEKESDTGRARLVVIRNNRISEKGRIDNLYSDRVGWVVVEIDDYKAFKSLPQRLVDKLKDSI
jgi:hypothetical protein